MQSAAKQCDKKVLDLTGEITTLTRTPTFPQGRRGSFVLFGPETRKEDFSWRSLAGILADLCSSLCSRHYRCWLPGEVMLEPQGTAFFPTAHQPLATRMVSALF